ncbi:MAG: carbon monoxide dehydrogenase [Candidatus Latescibacteria bacterium]|nr:carbon monoxide dehydrogenase [Candidatus Latescibacterota bacterium]
MQLEGTHTFNTPQETIWTLLNDPDVLARTTPGIKELRPLGQDRYEALADIKMGPINSLFKGEMEVSEKRAPETYKLVVNVDAKIGTVAATGTILLRETGDGTEVVFNAEARLTGMLARMGQRVLGGVGRMLTKQFFQALEREVAQVSQP